MQNIIAFLKQKAFTIDGFQVTIGILIVVGAVAVWYFILRK